MPGPPPNIGDRSQPHLHADGMIIVNRFSGKDTMEKGRHIYPERKRRELTQDEKEALRRHIEAGDDDIYKLSGKFACSTSQVAGIKAALHR